MIHFGYLFSPPYYMVYNRSFRRRRRRFNKKQKRYIFKKRGSRSQANQIFKLYKKVNKIQRHVNFDQRSWFNYYNEWVQNCPEHTGITGTYGYTCIPILDATRMTPLFDVPSQTDLVQDTWKYHGSRVHCRIDIDTENTNPIRVTTYLVSLRKETRATSLRNWGETLQDFFNPEYAGTGTPTSNNPNPIMCFSSGQTFINTKAFKIHAVKHKDIGEVGYGSGSVPVRNIGDTVANYYFKVKKSVTLSRSQLAIDDALADGRSSLNRDAQMFLIVVTNNSALDGGDLLLTATAFHTFSCI